MYTPREDVVKELEVRPELDTKRHDALEQPSPSGPSASRKAARGEDSPVASTEAKSDKNAVQSIMTPNQGQTNTNTNDPQTNPTTTPQEELTQDHSLADLAKDQNTTAEQLTQAIQNATPAQISSFLSPQTNGFFFGLPKMGGPEKYPDYMALVAKTAASHGLVDDAWDSLNKLGIQYANPAIDAMGGTETIHDFLDKVISLSTKPQSATEAFGMYWSLSVDAVNGQWEQPMLLQVHEQLKKLPDQDARSHAWTSLTLQGGVGGGWLDHQGGIHIGSENDGLAAYGQLTRTTKQGSIGDKTIEVEETGAFKAGDKITLFFREDLQEKKTISSIDEKAKTITLSGALTREFYPYTTVYAEKNPMRVVDWLDAIVRHEVGHAVDHAVGVSELTHKLAGWWTGTDFTTWSSMMGDPWKTKSGITPAPAEKAQIETYIRSIMQSAGGKAIGDGLPDTHPVPKYLAEELPVLMAAQTAAKGKTFWQDPSSIMEYNGHYFAINTYYHQFQYYGAIAHQNIVRDYSIFSPAEFFAELYTVYYEEAGKEDYTPGRLVPVAAWREWMTQNVHNRGLDPDSATTQGFTRPTKGKQANVAD